MAETMRRVGRAMPCDGPVTRGHANPAAAAVNPGPAGHFAAGPDPNTGTAIKAGSRTVNVEPSPWTLSTVRSPPIIRQTWREIARPSPVPPYLLRVDASA